MHARYTVSFINKVKHIEPLYTSLPAARYSISVSLETNKKTRLNGEKMRQRKKRWIIYAANGRRAKKLYHRTAVWLWVAMGPRRPSTDVTAVQSMANSSDTQA